MNTEVKHVITEIAFDKEETEKIAFGKTSEDIKIEIENAAAASSKDGKDKEEEPVQVANVKMQLIDTPELYSMLDETSNFMKALASTENFSIFRAEAV